MDELDVAFLTVTGDPVWQPLGTAEAEATEPTTADDGWTEVMLQIELDRVWDEVVSLLTTD